LPLSPVTSAVFLPCDTNEIDGIITAQTSSLVHDGILSKVVKAVSKHIATPLSNIINCFLTSGVFPSALKTAKVTPIFKTGDKNYVSNFKPISILPFLSKMFEKVSLNRLKLYLTTINIPSKYQYSFQEKVSTYIAIANVGEEITSFIDNKESSLGVFIDFSKAFDTVDHFILHRNLHWYGIRGSQLNLFESYLNNRMQYVCLNECHSTLLRIECGVPQGSILGPLLFLIYI